MRTQHALGRAEPSVTEAEFALLVRRAGLPMDEAQRRAIYDVYGHFEAMLERVRTPRGRAAEPAHVFVPGQGWGQDWNQDSDQARDPS